MAYWIFKSEPSTYSIAHLQADGREWWDGIRNYQARNFMLNDMKVGDSVFFYHSSCPQPGIYGTAKVCAAAIPDETQFDPKSNYYDAKSRPDNPRWWHVQVAFVKRFAHPVLLDELRRHEALADLQILQRGNRLSITPITRPHWTFINQTANAKRK